MILGKDCETYPDLSKYSWSGIEYFFMWKTTDRYVQQKRIKAIESESKLKQVYVPTYTRKSQRVTGPSGEVMILGKDCETYPDLSEYSWSGYKKYGRFATSTNP